MASDVTLGDGTRTINGWIIESMRCSIKGSLDSMPIPLGSSADTFLMDFGGKEQGLTLKGVLVVSTALGTGGDFATRTTLEQQVTGIETYFINADLTGKTFTLVRYSGDSGIKGIVDSFDFTRENPVSYDFQLMFKQGENL